MKQIVEILREFIFMEVVRDCDRKRRALPVRAKQVRAPLFAVALHKEALPIDIELHGRPRHPGAQRSASAAAQSSRRPLWDGHSMDGLGVTASLRNYLFCLRAVTSISMRIRGSSRFAEIIIAAGRTSPKYLRSTGQHSGNSSPSGST